MKKVLFFYGSFGGGHLSASKSLKEYIDKNYPGTETKIVDCIEYVNKQINKVTISTYEYIALKTPRIWENLYKSSEKGVVSKISDGLNKRMAVKLKKCILEFNPDLIISTHPFASHMCTILKKKGKINCRLGTVMTDLHIHNQWLSNPDFMDYYFVANSKMKEDMINCGIDENKIIISGIPFSEKFLSNFNNEEIFNEFNLSPETKTALFFAGGALGTGKGRTLEIFETLMKDFPELQVIAVAGKNEKLKNIFEEYVQSYHRASNVRVLAFTNKVPELMHISDFVITKPGGLTTTECFISGMPMVVINPIPGHEEQNAEFLESVGVAVWIKKNDDVEDTFKKLLSNPEKLEQMHINALKFAKPDSVKTIVETLMN